MTRVQETGYSWCDIGKVIENGIQKYKVLLMLKAKVTKNFIESFIKFYRWYFINFFIILVFPSENVLLSFYPVIAYNVPPYFEINIQGEKQMKNTVSFDKNKHKICSLLFK